MPRKLSEQDLGFRKHSRGSHCYNVTETLAKEAWELEAHSGEKKGASLGSLVPPPTTCLLQAQLHASAEVILLSLFSSGPGPRRKSGAQPSTPVFVCRLLPLKPTLEGPTRTEGDCGGEEQTLDLPHKSSYLASGILRGT